MNSTKKYGEVVKFSGEVIKEGSTLEFKAITHEDKDFDIKNIKGTKVISLFPSVNTKICDLQTMEIAKLSAKHPEITFVSISTNTTKDLSEWCIAHGTENIIIVSDLKHKEFATKTNIYIPEFKMLGRGIIILDENNKIVSIKINEDIVDHPDYSAIEKLVG